MKLLRRRLLHLTVSAIALPALSRVASALDYPTHAVRIVVGFSSGGPGDVLARLIGQWLTERLGQPFVVENRPGAGSNIGAEAVAKAYPDGYTLYLATSANATSVTFDNIPTFNFIRDIAPVASIDRGPLIMEVNPLVPAQTVPEFIAYAKANPGKINMASTGIGNVSHLAGELFKMMAGVNIVHVPYRGVGPAMTDLLGGQVQVMFEPSPASIEQITAGKLRALAVTTATRLEMLRDVPTVSEFLPGYEASVWQGIGAPKSAPTEIVEKLNKEINAGLADPKITARLADLGSTVLPLSPTEFGKLIADDAEKWGKVIRAANIKPQ